MDNYVVVKEFKANGERLKIGDPYTIGSGIHDDKLIAARYIKRVDESEAKAIALSEQKRNEKRQRVMQPDKYDFSCKECDFVAKSKAGLSAHMRAKHQEE